MVEITPQQILFTIVGGCLAAVVMLAAELLHWRRIHRLRILSFGPAGQLSFAAYAMSPLRVIAVAMLAWSLLTLFFIAPRIRTPGSDQPVPFHKLKHIVLILDVSPSMRLIDAGVEGKQSRMARAREVMESYFRRIPMNEYRVSVLATYTNALPVVEDTKDIGVVENVLNDLPMHFAFRTGDTNLFSGIQAAADVARGWRPRSATVVLVTDGDTVASTGMPRMPPSVSDVLVVGVGDPVTGSFLNGHHSRQDISTLRQIAARLHGTYHNGNDRHLPTDLIKRLTISADGDEPFSWSIREWALLALLLSAFTLSAVPILLHYLGTSWQPGIRFKRPDHKLTIDNHRTRPHNGGVHSSEHIA